MERDSLELWISGEHNNLFQRLRSMPFESRVREIHALIRDMRQFDSDNSDQENHTGELQDFLDECLIRL